MRSTTLINASYRTPTYNEDVRHYRNTQHEFHAQLLVGIGEDVWRQWVS